MTEDEEVLHLIQGVISDMPNEDQQKVFQCAQMLRAHVRAAGANGKLALGLVGAESAIDA